MNVVLKNRPQENNLIVQNKSLFQEFHAVDVIYLI